MEVTKSIREFKYNGVALKDPGPGFTLEQVREFYATLYPEIINAAIEGPTTAGAKTVYEFRRAVGTKGNGDVLARVDRLIARRKARAQATAVPRRDQRLHAAVALIAHHHSDPGEIPAAVMADSRDLPLLP